MQTAVSPEAVHRELVEALADALDLCEQRPGYNLPEVLRDALEELGRRAGGSEALIAHRPGSWEAEHVRRLASGCDW